mgnify:CR=1 FL=1
MVRKIFQILVYLFAAIGFVLVVGYFAVKYGITNTTGIIDQQRESFLVASSSEMAAADVTTILPWTETEEWATLDTAIRKDGSSVSQAAAASGVPARIIIANLVAEQLRLFFSDREDYKQFFLPLKILGSQTQFSWGIMGMKEETAIAVAPHLKDPASPFYPGPEYAHVLDYPATTTDATEARYVRLTDQHDHYWSYVYAGLYIKEVETQWANAGFPIDDKPAIISTLFNIGFAHSTPNAAPQVGGAAITVGGITYSFGGLAGDFYTSDVLTDLFPH